MKKTIYILSVMFFILQCKSPKVAANNNSQTELSIKKQIENGAFLVDVRSPEEFVEESFPGAINIPLNEVEDRIEEFKNKKSIIVFCRSGNRSSQAIKILESKGIQHLTNGINVSNMKEEMKK